MSGPSPSMVVRLAVTLGATTLLTIGAVGVGAATSDDGKKDAADESRPSRKGDKPITSVTPTEAADTDQGDADDSTTTTGPDNTDLTVVGAATTGVIPPADTSNQPGPKITLNPAATCLEQLNTGLDNERFQYLVLESPDAMAFAARPNPGTSPILPEPCKRWADDDDLEVRFVVKGVTAPSVSREGPLDVKYFPESDGGINHDKEFVLSRRSFNKADVSFCSEKKLCSG